jgi:hypothetical protein
MGRDACKIYKFLFVVASFLHTQAAPTRAAFRVCKFLDTQAARVGCVNSLREFIKLKNFLILRIPREFIKLKNFLIRVAPTRCIVLPSPFVPYGREDARKEDAQAFREFLGNSIRTKNIFL